MTRIPLTQDYAETLEPCQLQTMAVQLDRENRLVTNRLHAASLGFVLASIVAILACLALGCGAWVVSSGTDEVRRAVDAGTLQWQQDYHARVARLILPEQFNVPELRLVATNPMHGEEVEIHLLKVARLAVFEQLLAATFLAEGDRALLNRQMEEADEVLNRTIYALSENQDQPSFSRQAVAGAVGMNRLERERALSHALGQFEAIHRAVFFNPDQH